MYVPSFVPQPIEIEGNIAQERYLVRLGFIRRVVAAYAFSFIAIFAPSYYFPSGTPYNLVLVLVSLLALSLSRALAKGKAVEQTVSLAVFPALLIGLAMCLHHLIETGWPVWGFALGVGCAILYTFSCGRDLSFLGLWLISVGGSSLLILGVAYWMRDSPFRIAELLIANCAYLSFLIYDLAALLTRRRLGEEIGAVIDLYRDVLNMFSYPFRVLDHWRTHKIWSPRA